MRIDGSQPNPTIPPRDGTSLGPNRPPEQGGRTAADGSAYIAAPELAALVGMLQQVPEVRPTVLAEVGGRLARGEYLTPEAAHRTADAILGT